MPRHFFKSVKESVDHWYIPLIIGIVFIFTAIWTFISPRESYLALGLIFSIAFLISGLLEVFFALVNKKKMDNWGWLLALGIVTTLIGILLLSHPELSLVSLPIYIGLLVMFRSLSAIGHAIDLRHYGVKDWSTLMIIGAFGLILSFLLIWNPVFARSAIVIWTGLALLMSGIFSLLLGLRLRKIHQHWDSVSPEIKSRLLAAQDQIKAELESMDRSEKA